MINHNSQIDMKITQYQAHHLSASSRTAPFLTASIWPAGIVRHLSLSCWLLRGLSVMAFTSVQRPGPVLRVAKMKRSTSSEVQGLLTVWWDGGLCVGWGPVLAALAVLGPGEGMSGSGHEADRGRGRRWGLGRVTDHRRIITISSVTSVSCCSWSFSWASRPATRCSVATVLSLLSTHGFQLREIMWLTGQKSEASLRSYNEEKFTERKRDISETQNKFSHFWVRTGKWVFQNWHFSGE